MVKRDSWVTAQDLDQLAALFRLLADKTRLSILLRLAEGERNVTGLCSDLRLPQPTISHHLGMLRSNNLVGKRRHGKHVFYLLHRDCDGEVMEFSMQNLVVQVMSRRS